MKKKPIATINDPRIIEWHKKIQENITKDSSGYYVRVSKNDPILTNDGDGIDTTKYVGVYKRPGNRYVFNLMPPPYAYEFSDSNAGTYSRSDDPRKKAPCGFHCGNYDTPEAAALEYARCIDSIDYFVDNYVNKSRCDTEFVSEPFNSDKVEYPTPTIPLTLQEVDLKKRYPTIKGEPQGELQVTSVLSEYLKDNINMNSFLMKMDSPHAGKDYDAYNFDIVYNTQKNGSRPDIQITAPNYKTAVIVELMELGKPLDWNHVTKTISRYTRVFSCSNAVLLVDNPDIDPDIRAEIEETNEARVKGKRTKKIWVMQYTFSEDGNGKLYVTFKTLIAPSGDEDVFGNGLFEIG
jgi:hypothetical protein